MDLPGFFGATSPAQLAIAIFSGGTFAAILTFVIRWRGQSLDTDEKIRRLLSEQLTRSDASRNEEVKRLTEKLEAKDAQWMRIEKHWRDMLEMADQRLANSEKRHEECQMDRDKLREELNRERRDRLDKERTMQAEIDNLHKEVKVLRDRLLEASKNAVLFLEGQDRQGEKKPSEVAPEALKAAQRLDQNGGK